MAITTAVYNVPPNPNREKGAKEFKLFKEHKGNNIVDVNNNIIFVLIANTKGNPNVFARLAKESPIMIE